MGFEWQFGTGPRAGRTRADEKIGVENISYIGITSGLPVIEGATCCAPARSGLVKRIISCPLTPVSKKGNPSRISARPVEERTGLFLKEAFCEVQLGSF